MALRILITGSTGESMPPPYGGIQKVSLLYARAWKEIGHRVGITFAYRPEGADDHGAGADYFFQYASKPDKLKKAFFAVRLFFRNPSLYCALLGSYRRIYPKLSSECLLYCAYGVYIDGVVASFKPDIILSQAALIQGFMAAEVAKRRSVPFIFETYSEVHNPRMSVNEYLDAEGQKKYWTYTLNLAQIVIGMDNCSIGPLMYLPPERVKVFYDACDFNAYQKPVADTKEERRDYLKLPQGLFLVNMVGAFHYRKGHDHLIRAVGILKKRGYQIGASICGGSVNVEKDLAKWRLLAKEEGVEDRIFFFSNFAEEELVRLHRSADLYANLSNSARSCGLDLALLEAMAAGLPIVVYDNGALPSAVPEGRNGTVVKTGDVPALADAIEKISLMTPKEREAMGQESKTLSGKYDINATAKIKSEWLREVVENYRRAAPSGNRV